MKLEVGMYYRYKGIIGKYYKPDLGNPFFTNQHKYTYNEIANYAKFSHNIIDLIEVGDYVNGFRVDEIGEYHSIKTYKVETYAKVNCSKLLNCLYEEDIKSIVTHEQFESMSYKVGD